MIDFEPGMKVAYLARISRLENREEEERLASQDNTVLTFIKDKKLLLTENHHYKEFGSAYIRPIADRQILQDILGAAKRREFQVLFIFKNDRLDRNDPVLCILYIRELNKYGVQVYSYSDNWLDCSDPIKQLMVFISLTMAKNESYNTSLRVKAKFASNLKEGKSIGGVPKDIIPQKDMDEIIRLDQLGYTMEDIMQDAKVPARWVKRVRSGERSIPTA